MTSDQFWGDGAGAVPGEGDAAYAHEFGRRNAVRTPTDFNSRRSSHQGRKSCPHFWGGGCCDVQNSYMLNH